MMRRFFRALVLGLAVISLTGCWSNRPVEFRAMVLMLGIAPAAHGNIRLYFQIPTRQGLTSLTTGSGGGKGPDSYVIAGTGETPGLALTHAQGRIQNDIYLGQVQIIALSTKLSPSAFRSAEDWLTRLGAFDKTAYVLATPSVLRLLQAVPKNGLLPGIDLYDGFSCSDCESVNYQQHQWDIEIARFGPVQSVWMPYVTVSPAGFQTDRAAVYVRDRPVAILPGKETEWLGYLLGRTGKGYLTTRLPEGPVGLRTVHAKASHTTRSRDGRVTIRVFLHVNGTLDEWTGGPLTESVLNHLQTALAAKFQPDMQRLLVQLQREGADPFEFGQSFAWRHFPTPRRTEDWERAYRAARIQVAVTVHIVSVGDAV